MVRSLGLLLSGACLVAAAHAELQLTPKVSEYKADGATLKRLEFSDGGKTVTYQSPRGWEYSGSATQLTLRPPIKPQAEAIITRVPLSQPGSFDEDSLKKLVSDAVALAPKDSENIRVVSQQRNPLMIQSKETFLITLSYTFYGQKYGRSILFLNRGNEQIRFQLTCRGADFEELHREFLRSQYTWQQL
ncbi:MAG: hypothetical protein QOC70_459 [Verrucomicrobiota bacterium]|jgi:hypothetical protein